MPLSVTDVDPGRDTVKGGRDITITGTDFAAQVAVKFGTRHAKEIDRVDATTIRCRTPPQTSSDAVRVTVTNDPSAVPFRSGPSAHWGTLFRLYPVISSLSPEEAAACGGTPLTLSGLGFPLQPRVFVLIGGNRYPATQVVRVSSTRLTCVLPQCPPGAHRICVCHPLAGGGRAWPADITFCGPQLSAVGPSNGRMGGGTTVVIDGEHFAQNAQVFFGATPSPAVVVQSSTRLTAQAPGNAPGTVRVRVVNPPRPAAAAPLVRPAVPQTRAELDHAFTYGLSRISSIEPAKGPVGGGTQVTIRGHGFSDLAPGGVTVGAVAANERLVDDWTVTATTVAAAAGPANVQVRNTHGDPAAQLAQGFTYIPVPAVLAVEPAAGPANLPVTVQGSDFLEGATVQFGGASASDVEVVSATVLRCTTPAHAFGAVNVTVTNEAGDPGIGNHLYSYQAFHVTPERGPVAGGEQVLIQARAPFQMNPVVAFGGGAGAVLGADPLNVTTPAQPAGAVAVTVNQLQVPNAYTYADIWKVEPNAGSAGTTVDVYGAGFGPTTAVTLGGNVAAVVNVQADRIRVTAPAHAPGPVDVVVTGAGAGTFPGGYTYQNAPTVAGIEPASGSWVGGTAVAITGTDFVAGATVTLGGVAATQVQVLSPTTIRARTPGTGMQGPGNQGPFPALPVAVQNPGAPGGAAVGANLWTYRPQPTLSAAPDPADSPLAGGRSVVLRGNGFVAGARVLVGGREAAQVEFVNASTLRCRVPAHPAGTVGVRVHNPGDAAPGPAWMNGFTYVNRPQTVTSGNSVTFLRDGENFFEALRLLFERVRAAPPDPTGLTYLRLAFWNVEEDVTLGRRANFQAVHHRFHKYVERVARAGHNVELILWRPSSPLESRIPMGKLVFDSNQATAKKLYAIDQALAAVEGAGRVRVFLAHSPGRTGSSLHQKIAIASVAGQRRAIIGGLNLSNGYFASDDHAFPALNNDCEPWHDTAVLIEGPATDDIEAEWMRTWRRTQDLGAEWLGVYNVFSGRGELLARDFPYFERTVVRQRRAVVVENSVSQDLQAQNTRLLVATTRSEGSRNYTHIRDEIVERINAANNYIYFHYCPVEVLQMDS